ncbi:sodium/bile acid cotransporter 5-like [Diadema antillarum]|uniref:sodium/bile acid cotransporter 5-like n=1 Tax=Diadema antillarum TaxID=105358 RepID=UPI003A856D2F
MTRIRTSTLPLLLGMFCLAVMVSSAYSHGAWSKINEQSLSQPESPSWLMDIRAMVKRQAEGEAGVSTTTTAVMPVNPEQTTTTKKPKKKNKNKNKDKKNKKGKKNKKKLSTTPTMSTNVTNVFQPDVGAFDIMNQPLGENITMNAFDEVTILFEGHTDEVHFNFTNLLAPVIMKFESESEKVFKIHSNHTVIFDPNDPTHNGTLVVTLKGVQLGVSGMIVRVTDLKGNEVFEEPTRYVIKTRRVPRVIDAIFDYILLPLILITTAGMGCKMDFIVIRDKLKKPLQILVGPVCQFICQPFYAFCISKILKLGGITAVGLVTVGSCPGGGVSNMITLLLDADLILSVTMTFTSTCLAVAMLPINMLIYARHFLSGSGGGGVNIPFANIMIQIMMLTVPVLLGMLVHYKLPKVANIAIKSLNVLSLSMVSATLIIGIYSNLYIFKSEWNVLLGAFLLPSCGFITGFMVSKFIARFPMESALTIMVETGVQNNLIAVSMIKLSYPQPEADLMARMPIFVAISSITIGLIMICAAVPTNRRRRAERKKKAEEIRELDDRYDRYEFEPSVRNGSAKAKTNGHFPASDPLSEIPPSYEEAEPFITTQKVGKETIV